jgi:hypothetical protein
MSIILPNEADANSETIANNDEAIATAKAEFVANTTVLIVNAVANGLFSVAPFLPELVPSAYVVSYFQGLGYVVLYPAVPQSNEWLNPPFIAGFPEVLPEGYIPWNQNTPSGPLRVQISWS